MAHCEDLNPDKLVKFSKQGLKTNLIVNYLPNHINEEELVNMFSCCGQIQSVRIMKNDDGTSRGFGFVKYAQHKHALAAIDYFNGRPLADKVLKVAFSNPNGKRGCTNLFVKHIPARWTSETLRKVFEIFGTVSDSKVLETNGKTRLCGFVQFESYAAATQALAHRHGWTPPRANRPIQVHRAIKSYKHQDKRKANLLHSPHQLSPRSPIFSVPIEDQNMSDSDDLIDDMEKVNEENDDAMMHSIFVYGLPYFLGAKEVYSLFTEYGKLEYFKLQTDNDGVSLGCAFVKYVSPSAQEMAISGLDNCSLFDRVIKIVKV